METNPRILLYNRIEFKIYTASYYLNQTKELQKNHAGIHADIESVHLVIAIDGFLASLYGAMDSLFVLINDKLNLGLALEQVNSKSVMDKLIQIGRDDLLFEWTVAKQEGQWLHKLSDFRHQIIHRERLRMMREYNPWDNTANQYISNNQKKISLNPSDYMPEDMITYFENSFDKVQQLIATIRSKDQLLQLKKID